MKKTVFSLLLFVMTTAAFGADVFECTFHSNRPVTGTILVVNEKARLLDWGYPEHGANGNPVYDPGWLPASVESNGTVLVFFNSQDPYVLSPISNYSYQFKNHRSDENFSGTCTRL